MDDTLWGVYVEVVPAAVLKYDNPAPRSFCILNVNVPVAAAAPKLCSNNSGNGNFLINQGAGITAVRIRDILDVVNGCDINCLTPSNTVYI